jgi:dolichol-phosphate mannosyltransferase
VVATSRYRSGGSADGLDGFVRHMVSRASNLLAKLLFPRVLGELSDPMTGFFVIRRSAFNLDLLKPDGFKILVELICTHPGLRVLEVPMRFGKREDGDSKSDLKNGLKFLRQLLRLRFFAARHAGA